MSNVRFPPLADIMKGLTNRNMAIDRMIVTVGAFVGAFQIWRGIRSGAAAADGRIRRDERTVLYWSLLAAAVLIVGGFFYAALFWESL